MSELKKSGSEKTEPPARNYHPVRAPKGAKLTCAGWAQEAALRMLVNSLDEEVAEQPRQLIGCGETRKVLSDWNSYHATVTALKELKNDETLLVLSGRPVDIFETQQGTVRVMVANVNPASPWAVPGKLGLDQRGHTIPGDAVPGSWTYIGAQGILPTAFQILDAICRKHFGANLGGKLVVSGGMGATGGAFSLAAGMLGAAFLGVEADEEKIKRRIRAGYCDYCVNTLDEALRILKNAVRQQHAVSVGLVGNCAAAMPELADRGVVPDILTDLTGTYDLLNGYIPLGLGKEQAAALRRQNAGEYLNRARDSISRHFNGMLALQNFGSVAFEFGNGIQAVAHSCGVESTSDFPNGTTAYLQPLLSAGVLPLRWIALSGEQADIRRFDNLALELLPDDKILARWIPLASKFIRSQGLPARVCWLEEKARIVLADQVNKLVAAGAFKAPFVIAMEQVQSNTRTSSRGPVDRAKVNIETTGDWPILKKLLKAASRASWVSLDLGAGYCQATMALVADGSPVAAKAFRTVLRNSFAARLARLAVIDLHKLGKAPPNKKARTTVTE